MMDKVKPEAPLSVATKEMFRKNLLRLEDENKKLKDTIGVLIQGAKRSDSLVQKVGSLTQDCLHGVDILSEILLQKEIIATQDIDTITTYGTLTPTDEEIKAHELKMKELEEKDGNKDKESK